MKFLISQYTNIAIIHQSQNILQEKNKNSLKNKFEAMIFDVIVFTVFANQLFGLYSRPF